MIFRKLTMGLLALLLLNCQNNNKPEDSSSDASSDKIALGENESIYWVNSYKVYCTGVTPQMCLQIQKGEKLKPGVWENFFDEIRGFDWQPGFIYKIKVRENEIPASQVPADASSIRYVLVEELKKESDPVVRLHDIWALEKLDGKQWESKSLERPTLEIKLTTGKVMGTDGCNQYNGTIQKITTEELVLGPLASTKKACPDMELSDLFHTKMAEVKGYHRDELKLTLLNDDGQAVMQFKKVD